MIASVLTLTRTECQSLRIKDAYGIHRVVYSLFPQMEGVSRDFLFADKGGDYHGRRILALSRRIPQPLALGRLETKEIPPEFLAHKVYGFEVRLNPTKRDRSSGKTVALRDRGALVSWFCEKALAQYGFEVLQSKDGVPLVQVARVGVQTYQKVETVVTHGEATFVGKLQVVDREVFKKTFEEGMGRAKGFGFGLLQIVPLEH